MVCALASGRIAEKTREKSFPAEITSTRFTWKMSRCNFGGQNKKWRELFPVHEIGRIDGGKVFQNSGNVFQFGRYIFYDKKTKLRSNFRWQKGPELE
jgi:hypothetical protein